MKTTKEMIEVMQAYDRGEQIETCISGEQKKWFDNKNPAWNWEKCDYRVKPKPKYVPFETAEEFLAAQRVHGTCVFFEGQKYNAYINSNGILRICTYNDSLNSVVSELEYILDFTFADGTPCGKEVEL